VCTSSWAATRPRRRRSAPLTKPTSTGRFRRTGFYPSVSIMATWKGNLRAGMVENKIFGLLEGTPKQFVYFRIYGPEGPAFEGNWRLPDFTRTG
jgi:hypothetical protein